MPSVHKKRAQNSITFETKKIEEKRPVLTIGKTRRSKEHVAGLVIGRTLIRKGHYLECPPIPRYWEDPESKRASYRASSHTRYWENGGHIKSAQMTRSKCLR